MLCMWHRTEFYKLKIDLFRKLFVRNIQEDFILTSNFYFRNVQTKSPTLSHNLNPGPFGDNLNSSLKVNIFEPFKKSYLIFNIECFGITESRNGFEWEDDAITSEQQPTRSEVIIFPYLDSFEYIELRQQIFNNHAIAKLSFNKNLTINCFSSWSRNFNCEAIYLWSWTFVFQFL